MSTRTPVSTAFCILVMTSCLLNNFLLATPLVKRSDNIVKNIDTIIYGQREVNPNEDQLLQSEIVQKCRSLAYDDLSTGLNWRDRDQGRQLNNYLDLNKRNQDLWRSRSLFTVKNVHPLPHKFNGPDLLRFVEKDKEAETRLHSLKDETLTAARNDFHELCYHALNGLIGEISPKSNWNGERDQIERDPFSGRNIVSDLRHSNSQGNAGKDAIFGRQFLDQLNDQARGREYSGMSTISKRDDSLWVDLARHTVKRRRIRLSINNALMTLTDMLAADQARRILRQRSVLREQLLAAG